MHDRPCDCIPRAVLAKSALKGRSGFDLDQLNAIGEELVLAIGGRFYVHEEADFDWQAARRRIGRIIERYESASAPEGR
jgi:hypothetical protein